MFLWNFRNKYFIIIISNNSHSNAGCYNKIYLNVICMNKICSHDIFYNDSWSNYVCSKGICSNGNYYNSASKIHSTVNKLFKCTKDINNFSRQKVSSVVEKRYKRRKIECRQREIREKERRKDRYQ